MIDRSPCEFFLIRYVPNVVTGEFVNIGVILREAAPEPGKGAVAEARFTQQWDSVLSADPDADMDLLKSLAGDISTRIREESTSRQQTDGDQSILDLMQDSFSNSIQISGPHGSLAEIFAGEMDRLMRMYIEPQREAIK